MKYTGLSSSSERFARVLDEFAAKNFLGARISL